MKHQIWTDVENQHLKELVAKKVSIVRAAAIFKRNLLGVRNQARKLGTPFPTQRGKHPRPHA